MSIRTADAEWNGNLRQGNGHMRFGGGAFDGRYSFSSRFEEGAGTNPEELIAAAHAGCFSMAFAADLDKAGLQARIRQHGRQGPPRAGERRRRPSTGSSSSPPRRCPGIDNAAFQKIAEGTKNNCPVSRALKAVSEVTVTATLQQ